MISKEYHDFQSRLRTPTNIPLPRVTEHDTLFRPRIGGVVVGLVSLLSVLRTQFVW